MNEQTDTGSVKSKLIGPYLPILIFTIVLLFLAVGLFLDPRLIPSPLIGKPVPEFKLPPVKGRELGLATADFRKDKVSIMNVFASWCTACLDEHPLLMRLAATNTIEIYGLNYKDKPDAAAGWLEKYGDPYTRTGADIKGQVGIDWGVYGVPETFIVDRQGMIAYKHIGPIKQSDLDNIILPLIRKLESLKVSSEKNKIKLEGGN